jgi:hypothetical protein
MGLSLAYSYSRLGEREGGRLTSRRERGREYAAVILLLTFKTVEK